MEIKNAWCIDNGGFALHDDEVRRYIAVRPSQRQLEFLRMKYYSFFHFGMTTFTDKEWSDGTDSPDVFRPETVDTDDWCKTVRESGSTGVILTAKHHDGFCLFDSKYTDYTVMNSPFGKDVVALLAQSCKKYSLKLGLYLSPWDRHEKTYGTDEYNDFFVNQLTELCTNYGELFCLWFDGACGEGENGKKQQYDWDRYYRTIRRLQPNAVISISGPDVRWIGNEAGKVRKSEWSVIAWTDDTLDEVAESSQKSEDEGAALQCFDRYDEDLGSRSALKGKAKLRFSPAEADLSVTLGWFYHGDEYYKNEENHGARTPEYLADVYLKTVGGNASMLLNVPPDRTGRISERDKNTLKGFKKIIDGIFACRVPFELLLQTVSGELLCPQTGSFALAQDEAAIVLKPSESFTTLYIEEDIAYSQRVEAFIVFADGKKLAEGTVIGTGKIIRFEKPVSAKEVTIVITQSRSNPIIKSIRLYK